MEWGKQKENLGSKEGVQRGNIENKRDAVGNTKEGGEKQTRLEAGTFELNSMGLYLNLNLMG